MTTYQVEKRLSGEIELGEDVFVENTCPRLCDFICGYLDKTGVSRADYVLLMDIEKSYGYQILKGTRIPSRDNIIRTAVLLKMEVDDLRYMLKIAQKPQLYVKNPFDAKVFYALRHKMEREKAFAFIWGSAAAENEKSPGQ